MKVNNNKRGNAMLTTNRNGIEFFTLANEFNGESIDMTIDNFSKKMEAIGAFLADNDQIKNEFGELNENDKKALYSKPKIFLFAESSIITWLGNKQLNKKIISVECTEALGKPLSVSILDCRE